MRLESPLDLLWLVPLLGGIIALYLLKKRRREVVVPSLFLWEKIIQSVQADTQFQRLRPTLLLFLQLLTAFLLILAFAHPYLLGSGLAGTTYAIIIDCGAQMNSTDMAPSRLAYAEKEAQGLVAQMKPGDQALVIAASGQPSVLCQATGDRRQIARAIASLPATDTAADLPAAVTVARGLTEKSAEPVQIVVYSDSTQPASQMQQVGQATEGTALRYVTVATDHPTNVGIVAMDARRNVDNPAQGYQVFVGLRNFGPEPIRTGRLVLTYSGHTVTSRPVHIAQDGGGQTAAFQSPMFDAGGVVTATLTGLANDSLAADNTASVVIPRTHTQKVLLVTRGDLFLEKGLGLDPDTKLYEVAPQDFATVGSAGAGYDLVVFDDYLPASLPPGRYLVFHAVNPQMPVQSAGSDQSSPSVLDWNRTDPVMRFVDLSDLTVRQAASVKAASWGTTLAETGAGPLIVAGQNGSSRVVWVGFSPPDSNFGLSVSFPIFLTNALQWLAQSSASAGSSHPGQPLVLPHGGDWTITRPDHTTVPLSCPAGESPCSYAGSDITGVYTAIAGAERATYAVDLASDQLSDITPNPQSNAPFANASATQASKHAPSNRDIWPWVAAVALALLTVEWLAYHRRL